MMIDASERVAVIEQRLQQTFQPSYLEVIDDSAAHVGHAGAATGAGHFTVKITAEELVGKPLVAAHQAVYAALGELMQTDIHALQIKIVK